VDVKHEYGIDLAPFDSLAPADAVILAVPHAEYVAKGWNAILRCLADSARVVMDVKGSLDPAMKPEHIALWRM
jgi:UDP-N-acetyl-D-galactosamine dehydrogenase